MKAIADPGNVKFSKIAGSVKKGKPALLAHRGKFYVVASIDEKDAEELALCQSKRFWRIIEQGRASARAGKTVPLEEVKKRFGIK